MGSTDVEYALWRTDAVVGSIDVASKAASRPLAVRESEVPVRKHQSSSQTLPAAVWKRMIFLSLAILFASLIALDPYYDWAVKVCSGFGIVELVWHVVTLVQLGRGR